jgi:hypothetical protein
VVLEPHRRAMRWTALLACAAVVLTFLFIETRLANQPYDGPHEDNATAFMGAARNHLRYGLSRTLGQDLQEPNTGWYGDRSVEHFYLHHPPGLSLSLAASMAVFGDTHVTNRLTAATFTLFSLLAVLVGAYRVLGSVWASALAGALFTLTPAGAYYGRSTDYETFILPFMLWSQVLLVMHRQSGRSGYRTAAIVIACLGGLYDWGVYFWMLTAALYEFIWPRAGTSRWRAALPWVVAGASVFALVMGQIVLIAGTPNELLNVLLRWVDGTRDQASAAPAEASRVLGWFGTVFRREWAMSLFRLSHGDFTGPLMLAAVVSVIFFIRRLMRGDRQLTESQRLIALSATPGILYILAIPAHLGHEYALMPVLGAVSWAGADAVFQASGSKRAGFGVALLLCVWWTAGPWVDMYFGACFAPYRAFGTCERPVAFSGFGKITYRTTARQREVR